MQGNNPAKNSLLVNGVTTKDYTFAKVYQPLNITAKLKRHVEDFVVEEQIPVKFTGEGEHCWIYVQKSGCNTDWLAQQLAKYCGVKKLAVAYAGLKDRHAVTSQWFSIQLPGKPTPDWRKFEASFEKHVSANHAKFNDLSGANPPETVQILQSFRHNRKLQRGALKANRFKITLRDLSNSSD
ncbi:MAG: tRNA pseudouridine(13) synthase TruD, partial [Gammaproteobacteria bacterium]|nr:tRNA pseudouridine(13) synthase TruD [Gammaproteobacteria bacterium]